MGLKINIARIPLHWRLLLGAQLFTTTLLVAYRMRVVNLREGRPE